MGVNTYEKNIEVPKPIIWKVMRPERQMKGYIFSEEFEEQPGCVYTKNVHSFSWGEQHGILIDLQ
jgi:hypothetical protein